MPMPNADADCSHAKALGGTIVPVYSIKLLLDSEVLFASID